MPWRTSPIDAVAQQLALGRSLTRAEAIDHVANQPQVVQIQAGDGDGDMFFFQDHGVIVHVDDDHDGANHYDMWEVKSKRKPDGSPQIEGKTKRRIAYFA